MMMQELIKYTETYIRDIKKLRSTASTSEGRKHLNEQLSNYEKTIIDIKTSVKFSIDSETILDSLSDTYEKKQLTGKEMAPYVKLPFPKILIRIVIHTHEYYFILKNRVSDSGKEAISIVPFWYMKDSEDDDKWDCFPPDLDMYFEIEDNGDYLINFGSENHLKKMAETNPEVEKYFKDNSLLMSGLCTTVGHALILLNCYNIEYVNNPIYKKVISKGKQKKKEIYTYKTLRIKTGDKTVIKNDNEKQKGAEKSMHIRRGHFRKLNSGKVVWVSHSIVRKDKQEVVEKEYELV